MSALETSTAARRPLVLILGATGAGKSNLALSIAQCLPSGAEIINCDAMQMYSGLPIITNKIPTNEQQGIPHHLIDSIGLDETPWTVSKFVKESSRSIEDIRVRRKVPVMVGGTGYYAFGSLLKDSMLGDDAEGNQGTEGLSDGAKVPCGEGQEDFEILNRSTQEMLEKLKELDPEMAKSWHPNDRRKIQRSLEICLTRGRKASEIYRQQLQGTAGDRHADRIDGVVNAVEDNDNAARYDAAGALRHDPLIFWLSASDAPLKTRLNARVDQMVRNGLLEEALGLARRRLRYVEQGIKVDVTKGIWVSIGYKEMEPWAAKHLAEPEKYPKDCKLVQECIESVKAHTRQYAKRQERYVRIRLANALKKAGALDRLFLLDATDLNQWQEDAVQPAQELVRKFLAGEQLPDAASLNGLAKQNFHRILAQGDKLSYRVAHHCEICGKTLMTEKEWLGHLASRSHRKVLQSKKRRALVAVEGAANPNKQKAQKASFADRYSGMFDDISRYPI